MKRNVLVTLSVLAWAALSAGTAFACHVNGRVICADGSVFKDVVINVTGTASDGTSFSASTTTWGEGYYILYLPDEPGGSYRATIDLSTLPADATIQSPGVSVDFVTSEAVPSVTIDWIVNSSVCAQGACWFTGGGAKIDPLISIPVAVKGNKNNPVHSFGGNVYPGCSPTAGDGGNWNHVARGDIKLHFKGTSIRVVQCGNVTPPPPPGSTSPVTPYNFIEFRGTGTLKGIQGNKADYGTVSFFARCEDRNEPGSKGATDGALIDRYYLRVWDGTGTTRLLINGNTSSAPENMSPVPITDGNFQLHASSCDNPPN